MRASLVCIAVCAIADDSPISDETGPVAEEVDSHGIPLGFSCVNIFIVELWKGSKQREHLPCASLLGLLYAATSARRVWEGSVIYIFVATWV